MDNKKEENISIDSIVTATDIPVDVVKEELKGRHIEVSFTDETAVKEKFGG